MLRICLYFFCGVLFGQTQQHKRWDASEIQSIALNFPWSSSIKIDTHKAATIKVEYLKEGEYQSLSLLQKSIEGSSFYLEEIQHPDLNKPEDKLSAHKVVANSIEVTIPENLILSILAKDTQLHCSGIFKNINIRMEHGSGSFYIDNPTGTVQSLTADLHFYGLSSQKIPTDLLVNSSRGNIVVHPN